MRLTLLRHTFELTLYSSRSGQEEFESLCFDYGVELDDVVCMRNGGIEVAIISIIVQRDVMRCADLRARDATQGTWRAGK